jgi:hypothetical protein
MRHRLIGEPPAVSRHHPGKPTSRSNVGVSSVLIRGAITKAKSRSANSISNMTMGRILRCEGLKAGDRVIVNPPATVRDGMRVQTQTPRMAEENTG